MAAAAAAGSNALGLEKMSRRVLHAMPGFSACNEDTGRKGDTSRRQLHKRVLLSFPACMRRWRGREVLAFIMHGSKSSGKNDSQVADDASYSSSRARGNSWRIAPTFAPSRPDRPDRPPTHSPPGRATTKLALSLSKNTMLEGCHHSTLRCTSPRAS